MHQTSEGHDSARFSSFPHLDRISSRTPLPRSSHAALTAQCQASPSADWRLEGWRLSTRMSPARFLFLDTTQPYVT